MIPEEIKKKIAERPCDTLYGYELATEEKDKEIAELKEAIKELTDEMDEPDNTINIDLI